MAAPAISVFTLSHNKGRFAAEAIRSVLAQDFGDFEYWIIENSTDGGETRGVIAPLLGDPRIVYEEITVPAEERAACYVPAMLLNRYYPKAAGDIIMYLSDDDLLDPGTAGACAGFFDAAPARHVCWFGMRITEERGGGPVFCGAIPANGVAGLGTPHPSVDCHIDGGQVAHRRSCLDVIGPPPWFPETPDPGTARHADGLFLQKLADKFTFWPLGEDMLTHRRTPWSTWDHI